MAIKIYISVNVLVSLQQNSFMLEIDELQIERDSLRRTIDLQKEEINKLLEKVKKSQVKMTTYIYIYIYIINIWGFFLEKFHAIHVLPYWFHSYLYKYI